MIAEATSLINDSSAIYLCDYAGINVEQVNKLRGEFREQGLTYRVIKNTLFERALKDAGKFEKLGEHLTGMSVFVFADSENPIAPAKIIKKFNDDTSKLPLKACYIDENYYEGGRLKELAALPTKTEIIAGILGSLNSPASGIVGSINAVMRDLVNVIDQISKKEAA